jgi:hypothetical protein
MADNVDNLVTEIERLRWYLHEITVAWDCDREDDVSALITNINAHQWCDEDGFLPSDASIRRVFHELAWEDIRHLYERK